MVLTTVAVVVVPFVAVAMLREQGLISGVIPLAGAGLAISFALSALGSALWKASPASGDLLFGDLLVWGFVRRWMVDRRLSSAAGLLGLKNDAKGAKLSPKRQAELLERLGNSLEARDPYTHGHSRRVARHAATMAKRMGLPKHEVARIRTAAAIHDVGKVKTPDEVLAKPGKLSDKEFAAIKKHPIDGARMVERLRDPKLTKMVLHHHERLDGGGYPRGLAGEKIPLGARIIAVADTFDAITSARPYRSAKSHRKGLDVLRAESGTQLDTEAVDAFRSYYSGMKPVAIWAVLVNLPQRLFAGIFDELGASVASASKTAAATAATAATVVAGAAAVHAAGFSGGPPSGPETAQAAAGADHGALSASAGLPGSEQVDESQSVGGDNAPRATMATFDEGRAKGAGHGLNAGNGGGEGSGQTGEGAGAGSASAGDSPDEGTGGGGAPASGDEGGGNAPTSSGDSGSEQGGGSGSDNAGGGNPNAGGGNSNAGGGNSHGNGPGPGAGNPNAGGGNPNAGGGNPNAGGGNAGGGGSGNPNAGGGNPNAGGGNPNAGGGNPNAGGGNSQGGGGGSPVAGGSPGSSGSSGSGGGSSNGGGSSGSPGSSSPPPPPPPPPPPSGGSPGSSGEAPGHSGEAPGHSGKH